MREATQLKEALKERFEEVGLQINEQKSKIVYVDTFQRWNVETSFTFLGYDFELRTLRDPKGILFRKCTPGASRKAMKKITQTIRSWDLHRSTGDKLKKLASRYNATIRGWIEYYGKFWYRKFSYHLWSQLQSRLIKLFRNKYRISTKKAQYRLGLLQKEQPRLFCHWYLLRAAE